MEIRFAQAEDADTIHRFICELAIYEREPNAVEATPKTLATQLGSERPPFECLLAEVEGEAAGFAVFFHSYSTWKGRTGIYLEDLFVAPKYRGHGVGKALFVRVAQVAIERRCARFEWAALNWNTPAINFYKSFGAEPLDEWTTFRLSGERLQALADKDPVSA